MATLPRRLPLLLHLSRWSRNPPLSYSTFSAVARRRRGAAHVHPGKEGTGKTWSHRRPEPGESRGERPLNSSHLA